MERTDWPRRIKFERHSSRSVDFVSEAINRMVVYESSGLHKCVTDGWPYELEPSFEKMFAHSNRDFILCGDFFRADAIGFDG